MEYRGIIHNHSACSKEGCYPLSLLRQRWASHLDFAAMTEHAERTTAQDYAAYLQECEALSDEHFRFIPGLEVATESGDMLLLGCRAFICTRDPLQVIKQAKEQSFIILAHPEQGKVIPEVLAQAHGMEGWNGRYMGGHIPPVDRLSGWRKRLPEGKFLTGGNDIHKVDPKRKILTIVRGEAQTAKPCSEQEILEALRQGHFYTSNGIFSFTPEGTVFYRQGKVTGHSRFALFALGYRAGWRSMDACLQIGGYLLEALGIDKQKRTRLNRAIRQYL